MPFRNTEQDERRIEDEERGLASSASGQSRAPPVARFVHNRRARFEDCAAARAPALRARAAHCWLRAKARRGAALARLAAQRDGRPTCAPCNDAYGTGDLPRLVVAALAACDPRGASRGDYEACVAARAALRPEELRATLAAAHARYGVPPLDADVLCKCKPAAAQELVALYVSELATAARDAGSPGACRGGWRREAKDDDATSLFRF